MSRAAGTVLTLACLPPSFGTSSTDFASLFTAAFLWGLGDAVFNTQISAILGICFPDDTVRVNDHPITNPSGKL